MPATNPNDPSFWDTIEVRYGMGNFVREVILKKRDGSELDLTALLTIVEINTVIKPSEPPMVQFTIDANFLAVRPDPPKVA